MAIKKSLLFPALLILAACNNETATDKAAGDSTAVVKADSTILPSRKAFESFVDNKNTRLFILENKNGMKAAITNYGGRLVSLLAPDKNGKLVDVIIGFDSLAGYRNSTEPYFGATIGRYGNRIAKGKFTLDGKQYTLATNNGINSLHGGKKGFQYQVFDATQVSDSALELRYLSKDMEEGYPGNLQVKVTYTLTSNNDLQLDYEATTDKRTPVNLTNHAFFNLNGSGTINNHVLMINADNFTPVDSTLIPLGRNEPVANTPFDFRQPTAIGKRVDAIDLQIKNGSGYDHNFILNPNPGTGLNKAAEITGDLSGIRMEVFTEEPGLQFYGGNFMQSMNNMKHGTKDDHRTAFCLETQHFPDSPNQPSFPTTILDPGKTYKTKSVYHFSVAK
ncbi:MAG: galactose mutarotase [Chitinophagaceae bacterium]|nr:MAG: galactose mutarotase [Chitinophagaceae bacterium]